MNNQEILLKITFKPNEYLSYEKFVKYAIKDYMPIGTALGLMQYTCVSYPNPNTGTSIVFKLDGAKIHKSLALFNLYVSPTQLMAYGKSEEEFYNDWKRVHKK